MGRVWTEHHGTGWTSALAARWVPGQRGLAGPIRMRHFPEQRITVYELAA